MSKKHIFAGKAFVAAACALSIATVAPVAETFAYSVDYKPNLLQTLEINGTDYFYDAIKTSDGNIIAVGSGEVFSAQDSAVIASFKTDGTLNWKKANGENNGNVASSVIELNNGNILVAARISGATHLIELTTAGEIITDSVTPTGINVTDIAQVGEFNIYGVNGTQDKVHIFTRTDNPGDDGDIVYRFMNSFNLDDGNTLRAIRKTGADNKYIALGDNNDASSQYSGSSILFLGEGSSYRTVTHKLASSYLRDAIYDADGNILAVGSENNNPTLFKIDTDGNTIAKKSLEGSNIGNDSSVFNSIDILDNGEIVATGKSAYSVSDDITPKGGYDAVVARFDSNLNLISAAAYGGTANDVAERVVASGNDFFVFANVNSAIEGLPNTGSETTGIIARFGKATMADVTFKINGETPEGAETPEDGEYTWNNDGSNDLPNPTTPEGYVFSGWYTDKGMKNEYDGTAPTDDFALYGKFIEVQDVDDETSLICTGSPITKCENPISNFVIVNESTDPLTPSVPAEYTGTGFTGEWISDDNSIATIDQNGVITGVAEGNTMIHFVVYDENGNEVYRYSQLTEVHDNATPVENPATLDSFSAILLVTLASSAMLGFGIAAKARRR